MILITTNANTPDFNIIKNVLQEFRITGGININIMSEKSPEVSSDFANFLWQFHLAKKTKIIAARSSWVGVTSPRSVGDEDFSAINACR